MAITRHRAKEEQWTGHEVISQPEHCLKGCVSQEAQVSAEPRHSRGRHLLCNCSYILCTFASFQDITAYIIFTTNGIASWKLLGLLVEGC